MGYTSVLGSLTSIKIDQLTIYDVCCCLPTCIVSNKLCEGNYYLKLCRPTYYVNTAQFLRHADDIPTSSIPYVRVSLQIKPAY